MRVDQLDHAGAACALGDEIGGLLDAPAARWRRRRRSRTRAGRRGRSRRRRCRPRCAARDPSSSSAAARPVALLTPLGRTITAPLLKMICSSRPSSRIASSTVVSCGSQVATIDAADRQRLDAPALQLCDELGGGGGASRRFLRRRGGVEQRAVLGHDLVEDVELGKHLPADPAARGR